MIFFSNRMRLIWAVLCVYANWRQSQLIQTSHNQGHLFSGQCDKTIVASFIHHKICVTNQKEDVMSRETCFSLCLKRKDEPVAKGQLHFWILDLASQTFSTIALKLKVLSYNKVKFCAAGRQWKTVVLDKTHRASVYFRPRPDGRLVLWHLGGTVQLVRKTRGRWMVIQCWANN